VKIPPRMIIGMTDLSTSNNNTFFLIANIRFAQ